MELVNRKQRSKRQKGLWISNDEIGPEIVCNIVESGGKMLVLDSLQRENGMQLKRSKAPGNEAYRR